MARLEHALDLLAAIEKTAAALNLPVAIEGYPLPTDGRLEKLLVTPDPGVIEVNIHPARTWDELVDRTTTLYVEARLSRLGTEKFMLDGRHTGTGGGNHVTLGGPTIPASPRSAAKSGHLLAASPKPVLPVLGFVRRPDQPGTTLRRGQA